MRRGERDWPATALRSALETCRGSGDRWGEALTLRTIGELHLSAGRFEEADQYLAAAMRGFTAIDTPLFRARTLRDIARVQRARGDAAGARTSHTEAMEIFRKHQAREYRELVDLYPGGVPGCAPAPRRTAGYRHAARR